MLFHIVAWTVIMKVFEYDDAGIVMCDDRCLLYVYACYVLVTFSVVKEKCYFAQSSYYISPISVRL